MTTNLPFSQACENNKAPILERLREVFDRPGKVLEQAALPNILPVTGLDAGTAPWPVESFTWAFTANTTHIMAWPEVEQMFRSIGERLPVDGAFCLYGPFNNKGRFSSDSNRQFDHHLRARSSHMGIRDLEDLGELAEAVGLTLADNYAMPANNRLLVFRHRIVPIDAKSER